MTSSRAPGGPAGGAGESPLLEMPEEVQSAFLLASPCRFKLRAVSRRCRQLVETRFSLRCFKPPARRAWAVDFEINEDMTKLLYCAKFGGAVSGGAGEGARPAGGADDMSGAVTFVKWIPVYYRSNQNANRGVRHRLVEDDACALWRLLSKVRERRRAGGPPEADEAPAPADASAAAAPPPQPGSRVGRQGFLTVTEGCVPGAAAESERDVVGMLSAVDTELVVSLLDHRRNGAAEPLPAA